ncbi:head decoration protein [Marinobacter bryozoorum]|jgi:hypothetical protein|uniref:head decoration protein n=1 Tax=Marinobacter bryozoorum TaxID=256324 RepID=UPI0020052B5A|nr:head decoration protein [Marinobacter bryozoorum]MCK7542956.1 head decoration protein [Marinobacter bryozoorum]
MATFTESRHAGEFIISEANGHRSRDTVTVAAGNNLQAGHVVGALTAGGYAEYNPGNADGSETPAGVLFDAVDATDAAQTGVILARDCEVTGADLAFFAGATEGEIETAAAALAELGIIVR